MKISVTISYLLCLLALSVGELAAQNEPPPAAPKGKVFTIAEANAFDYGMVENNVYSNKFFGLRFTSPDTWEIQEQSYGNSVLEKGQNTLKSKNTRVQKAIDNVTQTVRILFTSKKGIGSEGVAIFLCAAEFLNGQLITSGTDYLRASMNGHKQSILPSGYEVIYEIKQDKLGAKNLPYYEAQTPVLKQRFYAIKKNNYGILFVLTYQEEADLQKMREILTNADFALK